MSGLGALIAVLGAGAQGYIRGKEKKAAMDRQDRLDAQQQEEYDYQKGQRDRASALRDKLAASQADLGVETVDPPEMSNADVTMAPPDTTQYKVGDQTFADQGQAQAALRGVNSKSAKLQRASKVYAEDGQIDKAQQYDTFARQAIDEGTDKVLASIQSAAPNLADLKKAGGTVRGTVGQEAADAFNQTGGRWNVAPDTVVEHYIDKTPAGREFVNSRVLGADGKSVVDDVHHAGLMLQDFKTRMEAERADNNDAQQQQRFAAEDADREARLNISRAELGIAQSREQREKAAQLAATPAGRIGAIETALHMPLPLDQKMGMLGVSKMSQPDQLQVQNLLKRQEQMDQIITKAKADGTWAPDSPGAKDLATQQAALSLQLRNVLGKYGERQAPANADPLGIGAAPAAAPAAKPSVAARGVQPAPAAKPSDSTILGRQIDVRNDPTIAALNEGAAKLAGKTDPQSVQQMMALGTARNARIAQLQQQYGSAAQLITQ